MTAAVPTGKTTTHGAITSCSSATPAVIRSACREQLEVERDLERGAIGLREARHDVRKVHVLELVRLALRPRRRAWPQISVAWIWVARPGAATNQLCAARDPATQNAGGPSQVHTPGSMPAAKSFAIMRASWRHRQFVRKYVG